MMQTILKLAKGNPGAAMCIVGLLKENLIEGIVILPIVEDYEIFGTDLYVFWSDICSKDYELMAKLCGTVPKELLKEACSKQDYSGRVLLKDYLNVTA